MPLGGELIVDNYLEEKTHLIFLFFPAPHMCLSLHFLTQILI